MRLQIFDVEHGACSLLTADNNCRLMIDCGHNATTGWRPGTYLRREGISMLDGLVITNYDEDHVSGAENLFGNVNVRWLWRNTSVSGATLRSLKYQGGMGPGIETLAYQMDHVFTAGPTPASPEPIFEGLWWSRFCNMYPTFDDENNLSMAVFLKCHGIGVMFTGDLEVAGFERLLRDNPPFREALKQTAVYVASHHGRESGCSDDVAALLTDCYYVVISDKGYEHDTQETLPFYRAIAKGGPFRQEGTRHVLTTRRDGRVAFQFGPGGWAPY